MWNPRCFRPAPSRALPWTCWWPKVAPRCWTDLTSSFLAHLDQRSMWAIPITWRSSSSSVVFNINMLNRNIVLWYFLTIIDLKRVDVITRPRTYANHTTIRYCLCISSMDFSVKIIVHNNWKLVIKLLLKNSFAKKSQITQTGMERQKRSKWVTKPTNTEPSYGSYQHYRRLGSVRVAKPHAAWEGVIRSFLHPPQKCQKISIFCATTQKNFWEN